MSWGIKEHYYSGQGVVLVSRRGTDGKPTGFRPVGNVPDLKITIGTSTLEHKESTTGQRGTDMRLTTETKCGLSFTMENFNAKNLADAMRGDSTLVPGAVIVGKALIAYIGLISALGRVGLSSIAVKQGAAALTPYVDDVTAWDYQANALSGSVKFNDGAALGFGVMGEVITAVAVGTSTTFSIASPTAKVGGNISVRGFTGANAAEINGKSFVISAIGAGTVSVALNSTAKVYTVGATSKAVYDGQALTVDYTFPDQYQVEALTQGATELMMRFEGLNTAAENSPVVVEVFRFLTDPLKELSLISDAVQQFVLEGSVLADTTRAIGSRYFNTQKLN